MPKRERMSSVDTAWLRMDRPNNLMTIVGVMILDSPVDLDRLKALVLERLCAYRRFRQCVMSDFTGSYWEDVADFDVEPHIRRVALPGQADKAELQRMVAELVSSPLNPHAPLWEYRLVENYQGGTAVISRMHHCIADGIALIGVLLSMTDDTREGRPPQEQGDSEPVAHQRRDILARMLEPVSDATHSALKLSGEVRERLQSVFVNPQQAWDYLRVGSGVVRELAELALMPDDSATRFKGTPGRVKCVAWNEPIPLAAVKAACKVLDCSVNDLLLNAVAGALGKYLTAKGDDPTDVQMRALVPVNLRPPGESKELGNYFGMVELVLPLGIDDPMERLLEVRRRMQEKKSSLQAAVTLGLLSFVGLCPKPVQDMVLDTLAAKATAVMTNVPGPQKPLYVAGARIVQQMFWVPQSGNIGMGVSILSYDGHVQFGLITDRGLVPDPETIISLFQPELERLAPARGHAAKVAPAPHEATGRATPKRSAKPIEARNAGVRRKSAAAKTGSEQAPPPAQPEPAAEPNVAAPAAAAPRVPKRFR